MIYRNTVLLFVSILMSASAFAATYTTLANGDWSNTTNVWSLDGVTPCGCSPGALVTNDQVIVNHDLTSAQDVEIGNNASLLISTTGSFTSNTQLIFTNSTASINGNVSVNKFQVNAGAVVDLNSAILSINARVNLYGIINIDGGYTLITGGNVELYPGAELNLDNGGKLDVQGGNITNAGTIDLCSTCCTTTSGNWRNNSGGVVSGSGAARSDNGNMRNFGSWAITVAWCSAGNAQGMPGFENCFAANATCNLVVLPVEFGEIEAEINTNNQVQINWNTVTERDNDYFILLRLENDNTWSEVARVDGAGSSTEENYYFAIDAQAANGTNYYKVRQVDYNGEYSDSDPVSVKVQNTELSVYPNPSNHQESIVVTGLLKGSQLVLINSSGRNIWSATAKDTSMEINLNTLNLPSGIYFIQMLHDSQIENEKLVVL